MTLNFVSLFICCVLICACNCFSFYAGKSITTKSIQTSNHGNPLFSIRAGANNKKSKKMSKKLLKKTNLAAAIKSKLNDILKSIFSIFSSGQKSNKVNKKISKTETKSSTSSESRLQKEIKSFLEDPPENCELVVGSNIRTWIVKITGLNGTIYAGEKFKLKMTFPKDYPSKRKLLY